MERWTVNSSMLRQKWFCNSRFYEKYLLPHTPLITNICSATLKHLIIDSNNIDGINPVIADINAPNLNVVTLGGLGGKFGCYDFGDVSSFLKNFPVMELELYNTYQPLQTLDCLSTVVKSTIQLHENIQDILFPCQFPNLADLQLKGTIRSLNQFTSRIYAPHLTSLGVDFISLNEKVVSVDEAPKIVKRIVEMYPKLEELSVANFATHGVHQRPDIIASVLMLSSRLKRLRIHRVDVEFLQNKITLLKLKTLGINSGIDFEMNIILPNLEFLNIYCRGLNVVINPVLPALYLLTVFAKSVIIHETNVRSPTDYPKLKQKLEIHVTQDAAGTG